MKYKPDEMMVVSIARLLKNGEKVFHGVASPVPMIAIQLARELHAPDMIYINISGGVNPTPSHMPKSTVDNCLLEGSKSIFTLSDIFDLCARGELDTAFLSAVQIDARGNLNTSVIGDFHSPKIRLPGGAGSAALLPKVKRAIIWRTKHDKKTFVESCDFVTATGNVEYVVSPLCVFKKIHNRLQPVIIFPGVSEELIQDRTGFALDFSYAKEASFPTEKELHTLKKIDPQEIRKIEFV